MAVFAVWLVEVVPRLRCHGCGRGRAAAAAVFTVTVGEKQSAAASYLKSPADVEELLKHLAKVSGLVRGRMCAHRHTTVKSGACSLGVLRYSSPSSIHAFCVLGCVDRGNGWW